MLSSTKAAKQRSVEATRSYTADINPVAYSHAKLIKYLAFHFDVELARRVYFHPVLFCKSRLFDIDNDFNEITSARLFVRNLDFDYRYIDIVNLASADAYIEKTVTSFEKQSYKSIRRTWDRLDELRWAPGQNSIELSRALGLPMRRKPAKSRKT